MADRTVGAYRFKHRANKGKISKIIALIGEYRKTAEAIARLRWKEFYLNRGKFQKYTKLDAVKSNLSERYKQTCDAQVLSMIRSHIEQVKKRIFRIVWSSSLSREDKVILSRINSRNGWYSFEERSVRLPDGRNLEVEEKHKSLIKSIFRSVMKRLRKPSFRKISLHLDSKVFELKPKAEGKAKNFEWWLALSTLEKGKRVLIPLISNPHAERLPGKFLNFIQIVERNGEIEIKRVKELENVPYAPVVDEIAIDIGLKPLMATDRGDLIGRNFYSFLEKLDRKITGRLSYLQRSGLKPLQDKKYVAYVRRLREFLKKEINRFLNRIVDLYKPANLIIEKLDFRSPGLSRRMNRLVQNLGRRYFLQKVHRLRELLGIEVVEVNPAYTSQECSNCGYVDERNRKDTQSFECKACGLKLNAQVNGARNIRRRSSLVDLIKLHTPKKKVLSILAERYKGCNSAPRELGIRDRELGIGDSIPNSQFPTPNLQFPNPRCGINVYRWGNYLARRSVWKIRQSGPTRD
ncbi:MAG: zinc ribbon domain-containing protein [Thermodesulforhabdaceae bacterium]